MELCVAKDIAQIGACGADCIYVYTHFPLQLPRESLQCAPHLGWGLPLRLWLWWRLIFDKRRVSVSGEWLATGHQVRAHPSTNWCSFPRPLL